MSDFISQSLDVAQMQNKAAASASLATQAIKSPDKIREAAEDFEAVFLTQMVEQMFSNVGSDNFFGGGQGEKVFRSLLAQEYGKTMASNGGIGIADEVQKEMLRMQEAQ